MVTVLALQKMLEKLVKEGHGRKPVFVNKATFTDNRESDGVTILPASGVFLRTITMADDDGGTALRKDGSESLKTVALVFGSNGIDGLTPDQSR